MLPTVSAILLTWHRPENAKRIVEQLASFPFVGEILVWRNDPSVPLHVSTPKARIIDSATNVVCYGRYLCSAQAANPLIYVQDDDVLVDDIPCLVQQFTEDPTRIHFNLSDWHFDRRQRHYYGGCHSALVGWGAIFRQDWLSVLDLVPPTIRSSALFMREADQYFTILLQRHHLPRRGAIHHCDGHSTPGVALWCAPEHWQMSSLAVREALGLVRSSLGFSLPPMWHVVVTCHNYARYLTEAVESVTLNDADYALTIVDDASTDDTRHVLQDLLSRFPYIRCVTRESQGGTSAARNHAIGSCDSAFIALLDADDRFGPDYLFDAGRVLSRGVDIANPDAILFGAEDGLWEVPPMTTLPMLLQHNSIHYCAAFRRSWWIEIGGFNECLKYWEDYDFWIRMVSRGARAFAVSGDHFYYRLHPSSKTSSYRGLEPVLRASLRKRHRSLFDDFGIKF